MGKVRGHRLDRDLSRPSSHHHLYAYAKCAKSNKATTLKYRIAQLWLEGLAHCSGGCLPGFVLSVLMDVLPRLTKNKWTTKYVYIKTAKNIYEYIIRQALITSISHPLFTAPADSSAG